MWNVATGQLLGIIRGRTDAELNSVAFSPSGKWLASASADHTVRTWDATTGLEIFVFEGHTDAVKTAVFSPDGKLIIAARCRSDRTLVGSETGLRNPRLQRAYWRVRSAAFSPDGQSEIVTASADRTARVFWDVTSAQKLYRLNGHTDEVAWAAFSPDGTLLITAKQR